MQSFEFSSVGRILFGCGRIADLGSIARSLGRSAFVIFNGPPPGAGGVVDRVIDVLNKADLSVLSCRQQGEPTVADVDRAMAFAQADIVVGVGGGSAIDTAKAVAGLLTNGGSPTDYMEVVGKGLKISKPAAPWIAVPTTAGTGA